MLRLLLTAIVMPVAWKTLKGFPVGDCIFHLMDKLYFIHCLVDKHLVNLQPFLYECFTVQTSCHDSVNIPVEYISIIKMDFFKPEGIYTYI